MSEKAQGKKPIKVLIVDDDQDFRMQARLQLEADGHKVVEAENTEIARQLLVDEKPDIAIVDLMMDEVDAGFTLCYQMKKTYPNMPIILATGAASETGIEFDSSTDEERSWVKADVVLNKPIRFEQLTTEIHRLLDK
ncbi:TPA: response regulator [Candidatus Sumerlaeota bacterium]|jgi:two-component system, OmpR family, response regulator|nr:response regulator [Candidatus Sumerlaeota bacterium]